MAAGAQAQAPPEGGTAGSGGDRAGRFGVFGDLPTRLLVAGLRVAPWFVEPFLLTCWTLLFFAIAGEQRRAVAGNLRALFPKWSRLRAIAGAYRVFWNFGATYVDALRGDTGTGGIDWVIEGMDAFEKLAADQGGSLILTAHMGNYDMAAPMFSSHFGRRIYAVRAPERVPEMQAIREAELREKERRHPLFKTLYNQGEGMLGVELARLLNEGNIVAVQGDRVVFEVSPMEHEVEPGLVMKLPRGPLYLARMTGATCYPLFILRDGWRRYRVLVKPPLELPPRRRGGRDEEAVKVWTDAILEVVRPCWAQWFVFEPVLRRKGGGE